MGEVVSIDAARERRFNAIADVVTRASAIVSHRTETTEGIDDEAYRRSVAKVALDNWMMLTVHEATMLRPSLRESPLEMDMLVQLLRAMPRELLETLASN